MDNIALAFSGGGFRAAAYSWGCLSYLKQVLYKGEPLLYKVTFISSSSGGSITNLAYSKSVFEGRSFEAFEEEMEEFLDGDNLLRQAMEALHRDEWWKGRPEKSRNLINAFSVVYDKIWGRGTFGVFSDRTHRPHIEEICVNATEFTNGLPFRFQSQTPLPAGAAGAVAAVAAGAGVVAGAGVAGSAGVAAGATRGSADVTGVTGAVSSGRIGNAYIYFAESGMPTALKIRLADILASSSCFPSGFEPVIFPEDFTYSGLGSEELRAALSYKTTAPSGEMGPPTSGGTTASASGEMGASASAPASGGTTAPPSLIRERKVDNLDVLKDKDFLKGLHIGLMDGGVDDNQAIDAFELAVERRERNGRGAFTIFLACDVTSNFMDGYTLPLRRKSIVGLLPAWFPLTFWIAGLLTLPLLFILVPTWWPGYIWVLATLSVLCWLPLLYWGLPALFKSIGRLFHKHPHPRRNSWFIMLKKYGPAFLLLNLGTLKQMLLARIKSVLILSTDVYLKQIRRMYYNGLYTGDSPYREMAVQNAIYGLTEAAARAAAGASASGSAAAPRADATAHSPQPPSQPLVDIAERARMMGTTLWFGPGEKTIKDDIIITGQATTCYNLLKWLGRQQEKTLTQEQKDLQKLLRQDWQRFCEDPSWLYKQGSGKE